MSSKGVQIFENCYMLDEGTERLDCWCTGISEIGGFETFVKEFGPRLVDRGYQVTLAVRTLKIKLAHMKASVSSIFLLIFLIIILCENFLNLFMIIILF